MTRLTRTTTETGLVLDWAAAVDAGPEAVGGKGWNLGRLDGYGLPVPPGVVLTAAAYRAFMAANGLADQAATLDDPMLDTTAPAVVERLAALQTQIKGGPLPPDVRSELEAALDRPGLRGVSLAVRSSATAEDGSVASFAGIHHSSLNVPSEIDQVEQAVKRCYASLWTPHAVAYRAQRQIAGPGEMAVVIVRLVPAVASGVAFSADPAAGRRDQVLVTANFGLGESVVGGLADVDEYRVRYGVGDRPRIVERRLGRKERQTVPAAEGGTATVERPTGQGTAVLSDQQALAVAALAVRCQDALGKDYGPQDVEWVWDGERFWVVQARPITQFRDALPAALRGQPIIWSTANLKEVLPPVYTPYSWSTVRLSMGAMLESLLRAVGYETPEGMRWIRLRHGHPYFNLSLIQWSFFDAFGTFPEQTNRMLGGRQPTIQLPPGRPFAGRAGLGRLRRTIRQLASARAAFPQIEAAIVRMQADVERALRWDVAALGDEAIEEQMWWLSARLSEFMTDFMRANTQASIWLETLVGFMGWLVPGDGRALATRLLAGTGGIASAEQGYRLVEVARIAAQEPAARDFFLHAGGSEGQVRPGDWQAHLAGTRTGDAFAAFLRDFGHRGVDELEIANPRWVEDPSYLVATVREHIASGLGAPPDARAARRAAESELRRRLRSHPLQPVAWWVLSQARRASALRENTKSVLVLTILPFRRALGELGTRLTQRQILASPDDLYFLTLPELEALLGGRWDGRGVPHLVADRRARYAEQRTLRLPDVLLDDAPVAAPPQVSADDAAGGTVFEGLGVAAGVARGPARVILHPRDGHRLQKGEILVAPTTDPGWTPLFLRAAGLVMETGGYLSHGAIVAREYGIPAVANTPGILDTVADGDALTVDGDTGRVIRRGSQRV